MNKDTSKISEPRQRIVEWEGGGLYKVYTYGAPAHLARTLPNGWSVWPCWLIPAPGQPKPPACTHGSERCYCDYELASGSVWCVSDDSGENYDDSGLRYADALKLAECGGDE